MSDVLAGRRVERDLEEFTIWFACVGEPRFAPVVCADEVTVVEVAGAFIDRLTPSPH
ncbi:MAG: hypothetical protein ABSA07_08265 [Acidimicrobiales bacterium]